MNKISPLQLPLPTLVTDYHMEQNPKKTDETLQASSPHLSTFNEKRTHVPRTY